MEADLRGAEITRYEVDRRAGFLRIWTESREEASPSRGPEDHRHVINFREVVGMWMSESLDGQHLRIAKITRNRLNEISDGIPENLVHLLDGAEDESIINTIFEITSDWGFRGFVVAGECKIERIPNE